MINKSILNTTHDIPFPEARISIRNPRMEEIFLIGERNFHNGCRFLTISKKMFSSGQDKFGLEDISDFNIFMSIMCSKEGRKQKRYILSVLHILFPNYIISFNQEKGIILQIEGREDTYINNDNYESFKDIIVNMFSLNETNVSGGYNPADKAAERIAEKFAKRKKKDKDDKSEKDISIFGRYISILTVGEHKDWNSFMGYTAYQLKDEFTRFMKKENYDMYIEAKIAGAKDLDEVDNWMDDIHS